MKKTVQYVYLGTNGTIISPVHLEDIYYTIRYALQADPEKYLTNGTVKSYTALVSEDDLENWKEVVGQI